MEKGMENERDTTIQGLGGLRARRLTVDSG